MRFLPSPSCARTVLFTLLIASGAERALAHDLRLPLEELQTGAQRLQKTLAHYRKTGAIPPLPKTPEEHRRVLGVAEIEIALGNRTRALELLMGRLADPAFHDLPEYVETLLFTSEILESQSEEIGAMHYAELALQKGGTPEQMAEAGARWFRLARSAQRIDRRLEIYELWRARGGEKVADTEGAASVLYEVAFALRADVRRKEARALLQRVPSESAFGSRAAYLSGVTFVEDGDLASAERWFRAIMDWQLPELPPDHPQLKIEIEMRQLAALAGARLLYEKGDLDGAATAYQRITAGSPLEGDACWELAYLDLDKKLRRAALKDIQCVFDLGARGTRYIDARLFKASLLAHLSRYGDSIEAFERVHLDLERERAMFAAGAKKIDHPAEMLFSAMERSSVRRGREASPGPATLFGDAWTKEVDQAYRIDRGTLLARSDLASIASEIDEIAALLAREDAFVMLQSRRAQLERLLREAQHLLGHAGDLKDGLAPFHASIGLSSAAPPTEHAADAKSLSQVVSTLNRLAHEIEKEIEEIDRLEAERRALAQKLLAEIRTEVHGLSSTAEALQKDAAPPVDAVAKQAIDRIDRSLRDAAMRSEVGILDTYWLKKEHRTQAIEELLRRQKDAERQVDEALRDLRFDGDSDE